jgi:uncharacterized membrane protein YphA (DoxX/SURF4 family)
MILISRYRTHLMDFLQSENHFRFWITLFCKSLYVFLFVKIIFLGPVLKDIIKYLPFEFILSLRNFIYAPVILVQFDLNSLLILIAVVVLIALLVKLNYYTSSLIFWLSFNLTVIANPVTNGSDMVLNLFLFISIFLSEKPFLLLYSKETQQIISNFAFLLCRLQLVLIYLLSGFDKLISVAWQSGDAIYAVVNHELYSNSLSAIPFNKVIFGVLAWMVIIFELGFVLLIWFSRFRIPILIIGFLFHLGIIFFLNLPDFGIIMMLSYILFIPYQREQGSKSVLNKISE